MKECAESQAILVGMNSSVPGCFPGRERDRRSERQLKPPAKQVIAWVFVWMAGGSEEHTSELQSLMRQSYAVFCLKKNAPPKNSTYLPSLSLHDRLPIRRASSSSVSATRTRASSGSIGRSR